MAVGIDQDQTAQKLQSDLNSTQLALIVNQYRFHSIWLSDYYFIPSRRKCQVYVSHAL